MIYLYSYNVIASHFSFLLLLLVLCKPWAGAQKTQLPYSMTFNLRSVLKLYFQLGAETPQKLVLQHFKNSVYVSVVSLKKLLILIFCSQATAVVTEIS